VKRLVRNLLVVAVAVLGSMPVQASRVDHATSPLATARLHTEAFTNGASR
jgi:hypothetical protein